MYVFLSTERAPELTLGVQDAVTAGQSEFVPSDTGAAVPIASHTLWGTMSEVWDKGIIGQAISAMVGGQDGEGEAADAGEAASQGGGAAGEGAAANASKAAPDWTGLVDAERAGASTTALLWRATNLTLRTGASTGGSLAVNVSLPDAVRTGNSTLLAHVLLCHVRGGAAAAAPGADRDTSCLDSPWRTVRVVYPVVLHRPKKAQAKLRSLLDQASEEMSGSGEEGGDHAQPVFGIGGEQPAAGGDGADGEDSAGEGGASDPDGETVLPYWRPTLHIASVAEGPAMAKGKIPPHVPDVLDVTPDGTGYVPMTVVNDWWLLARRLSEVNATTRAAPLEVSWEGISLMYWTVMTQWSSQSQVQQSMGVQREGEAELIKQVVMETNPWLLGVTFAVSALHTVFEFLAFRADISFWRRAKTMEGLSVKSILINVVVQLVILLYLFDNNTSWMILLSNVVGTAIEVWKLRKAVSVSLVWRDGWPAIDWTDKDDGYVRSKTKQYDDEAISNLGAILLPLMLGYAGYSLFYARHKSWYSWVLSSLVGFVYAFGFVLLVPQVYLNYKLRSVAHMPWKAMVYKSLNTFVDDIFAFVIPAPTMHRLATLRDDVIFFVYLYQRCVYPVDTKRINEFGMSGEDELRALETAHGAKRRSRRRKTDRHTYVALVEAGTLEPRTFDE